MYVGETPFYHTKQTNGSAAQVVQVCDTHTHSPHLYYPQIAQNTTTIFQSIPLRCLCLSMCCVPVFQEGFSRHDARCTSACPSCLAAVAQKERSCSFFKLTSDDYTISVCNTLTWLWGVRALRVVCVTIPTVENTRPTPRHASSNRSLSP